MQTKDYMNIKTWADNQFKEHLESIRFFISEGIEKKTAYHMVADASCLGAGYKAQMRKEIGLGMFE